MSENEIDDIENNNNKRKRKFCKELVKKLKQDILQYDNNSLSTYFNFIQHYINKEIKNNPKNSSLLITKLPAEILINILQFLDFNNLFNFYKVCKDWYSLLFCNEYFWNLQYFNYFKIVENKKLENKKFKKNKNKNLNENLNKINWKEKRNYLILKFNKYLNQLDLIKNKKYKFINIIFDLEDHESSYNEELNLLSDVKKNNNEINNETDLLFTKNTMFTKINVVTINRYEDDGGGLKCDGNVEGYFFYDKSPIFFKFILNFKVDYDVNGENSWDYNLSFYKDNKEFKILEKIDKNKYIINKNSKKQIKEWLQFKYNSDVDYWLETFLAEELSFLDLDEYRMGLLEKCLQIEEDEEENQEEEEENEEDLEENQKENIQDEESEEEKSQ